METKHALPASRPTGDETRAEGPRDGTGLLSDALPLEVTEIDDRTFSFVWYFQSGVDRLSLIADGETAGVVEALETPTPRLLCDTDLEGWFAQSNRAARVLAAAHLQWRHRGEIVAEHALSEGGAI
ncbi:hypothetical protein GCM10009830_33240 [Glycomyces endophyticus]|uniref:Uncharacterized protein n=1 Tax=Glycomyces endophyticus TaxID=480996 RepID=A0ABP4T732_9ACTN